MENSCLPCSKVHLSASYYYDCGGVLSSVGLLPYFTSKKKKNRREKYNFLVHTEKLNESLWNILAYNIFYYSYASKITHSSQIQTCTHWLLRHLTLNPRTFGQSLSVLQERLTM